MAALLDVRSNVVRWRMGRLSVVLAGLWFGAGLMAAEPKSSPNSDPATPSTAAKTKAGSRSGDSAPAKLDTEIDISGPYHANINGETFPSTLDIWGPKATLRITMDGQDRPMTGMFMNEFLKVGYQYGAANFNLATMVQAKYSGRDFNGQYDRIDAALGTKSAPIVLTPTWCGGGSGGRILPLPRQVADVPGEYRVELTKDGRTTNAQATIEVDGGTVKVKAGGREYVGDFSDQAMYPVFWEDKRMDTFQLIPTTNGFKGKLFKDMDTRRTEFEVLFVKQEGTGGGGHERHWTYVYDAIIDGTPPVWIAKLTLHEDEADLVIDIKDVKATMTGSLVENILSGTGKYGNDIVSIRAQKTPNGFAGALREGSGTAVREHNIVLKNRHVRATRQQAW